MGGTILTIDTLERSGHDDQCSKP